MEPPVAAHRTNSDDAVSLALLADMGLLDNVLLFLSWRELLLCEQVSKLFWASIRSEVRGERGR
jgi:hypothetical protein